jgi:hypothetical protein
LQDYLLNAKNSLEHKELLEKNGFIPEPVYGNQLAINGIFMELILKDK